MDQKGEWDGLRRTGRADSPPDIDMITNALAFCLYLQSLVIPETSGIRCFGFDLNCTFHYPLCALHPVTTISEQAIRFAVDSECGVAIHGSRHEIRCALDDPH